MWVRTMAKDQGFVWDPAGYADLRKSAGVASVVQAAAESVRANATSMTGENYDIARHTSEGLRGSAVCTVHPYGARAIAKEYKHNILIKAMGSARV